MNNIAPPPIPLPIPPPIPPQIVAWPPGIGFLNPKSPDLRAVEQKRKGALFWFVVGIIWAFTSLAALCFQAQERSTDPSWGLAAFVFGCLAAAAFVAGTRRRYRFRNAYKQAVLPQVVRQLNPGFEYRADWGITMQRFLEGSLFLREFDSYHAEDYVRGKLGATAFEFSEVAAARETTNRDGDTIEHPIFRGIYFIADFNKHFRTRTVVMPDRADRGWGFIGRARPKKDARGGHLIRLEDPDFEREFGVYGEDEVEARYILTPALMARILALKRRRATHLSLSFLNGQVHIALGVARDLFEPDLFRRTFDQQQVAGFLNDLRAILEIIEILNLNMRIWSKT